MKMEMFITGVTVVAACLLLQSCDPGYALVLRNISGKEHHITVVYPDSASAHSGYISIHSRDSIALSERMFGSTKDKSLGRQPKSWTSARSYSFILPAEGVATTESGFGVAPRQQAIVVDGTDTLDTWNNRKLLKKRPIWMLGGTYTLPIK